MGMFDYVRMACPECHDIIEEQSKAGPCLLNDYSLQTAPEAVIRDLAGEDIWCTSCNNSFVITYAPKITYEAALERRPR